MPARCGFSMNSASVRSSGRLPHRLIETVTMRIQGTVVKLDLRRLPGPHKHIALVPQWDFLELLADAAEAEPTFRLMRSTEVLGPVYDGGRVAGVRYRTADGAERQMRAVLTVACDGRSSTLRSAAGLVPRNFGAPMDVWWYRLPRRPGDPSGLNGEFADGAAAVVIDRGDYYQIAYLIAKGSDARMRADGVEALRRSLTALVPWLAGHADQLTSFDDVKLLEVQLNRLRKWYSDGLLVIGDAAHAMSPVGGVGINLAVADAVAAARILAPDLRADHVSNRKLAQVQARRLVPAATIQRAQSIIHHNVVAAAVKTRTDHPKAPGAPLPVRVVAAVPAIRSVIGYAVAIGPLPESAPEYARRSS